MTDRSMGGIEDSVSAPCEEAATDRYGLPLPRGASELDATRQARAWLLRAKRTREPTAIGSACLLLVDNLLDRHRVLAASWALEDTLETLEKLGDVPGASEASWGLHLTLAALYERLGDPVRARATARQALHEATRADSELGRLRCHELLQRFALGRKPAAANDVSDDRRSA